MVGLQLPSRLLCAAAFVVGCGQDRPPSPAPLVAPTSQRAAATRPLDQLASPPPLHAARLGALLEDVEARARAERFPELPGYPAAGYELTELDPSQPQISAEELDRRAFDEEPNENASGPMASVNSRFLRREPRATVSSNGRATVHFATTEAIAAAAVYYGVEVPSDPFATERLRRSAREIQPGPAGYGITLDLRRLLGARYDVSRIASSGRGVVRWRLEVPEPDGSSRLHDGRVAFRCEPTPCGDRATFTQAPALRLGPFVDLVEPTEATITFETDVATLALVALGSGDDARVVPSAPALRHEVRLSGLSPGARHRYTIVLADAAGVASVARAATFATPPEPEADPAVRFAVLSDSRSGHGSADEHYAGTNRAVLEDLLFLALAEGARFVVFVGDLADGYTTHAGSFRYELEAWQRVTEPVAQYLPIYEAMGNHEALVDYWTPGWAVARTGEASAEQEFARRVVNPENGPDAAPGAPPYRENVYSFDAGPVHLAVVNTNYYWRSHFHRADHPARDRGEREGWIDDAQLAWLDADLRAAEERGSAHRYVFTHEPGFPNGGHVQDAMWWNGAFEDVTARRDRFFTLLADHGVEAVFHGDEHNYSRTRVDGELVDGMDGVVWQIISGGAGAPYYAQDVQVPWVDHVEAFDARQHLVIVDVDEAGARARVLGRRGETVERFELAPARGPRATPAPTLP